MKVMNVLKAAIKFIASITILTILIIGSYLIHALIWDEKKKYSLLCRFKCFIGVILAKAMQIKYDEENKDIFIKSRKNFLIISNHQTYLDTFILSTVFPAVFIANAGLKKNFFSHALNYSIGNIFIGRKSGAKMLKEVEKVTDTLREGINVILFPEGTTSDGVALLPFRGPFVKCAIDAGVDILPVCMKYVEMNGKEITSREKKNLIYHGHLNLFTHMYRLLKNGVIVVRVTVLDVIKTDRKASRKELTEKAYQVISREFSKEETE